ncbi:hypothetical protein MTR_5g081580 [Medicago truncatula]|uniref:Uncharacterized protein n=1 Tax=Medicago truncatula TaxID=3880 RepID=G7KBU3_MEDTR|nr:hypothetical protein MTR_5g081580 [Medicago truncatula]
MDSYHLYREDEHLLQLAREIDGRYEKNIKGIGSNVNGTLIESPLCSTQLVTKAERN